MPLELSDREKEVIECWLSSWDEGSMGLYGNLSYNDCGELIEKLGIETPPKLKMMLTNEEEFIQKHILGE